MSVQSTKHATRSEWLSRRGRWRIAEASLSLGALAVLGTGVVHIQQYSGADYSSVPTIGTLFFLNFVAAVIITAGLVAPLRRVAGRAADAIRAGFAVAGIGFGALSLAALFVSESSSGLFGFQEHGYRTPIALAIVAEAAAICFLVIFLVASGTARQLALTARSYARTRATRRPVS